jgi:hypothetical protein
MKISIFLKNKLKWGMWDKNLTLRKSLIDSGMQKLYEGKLNFVSENNLENAFQIPAQKINSGKVYVVAHDNELNEKGYVLGVSHTRGNLVFEAFSIDADEITSNKEDLKDACQIFLKKSNGNFLFPANLFYFSSNGIGYRHQPLVIYVSEDKRFYVRKSQLKEIISTMKNILRGTKRRLILQNNQIKKYESLLDK